MYNQRLIWAILLGAFLAISCAPAEEDTSLEAEGRTVNVETEMIGMDTFESFLRQIGTVTTAEDVQISAEVGGRIMEVLKREGSRVQEGETILRIDDRRLTQELRRLTAVTDQSKENYERLQRLYEEDGIGSEIELLNAKYTYEQNQALLESTKIDLENTAVKAPFNGTIENIMMEAGEMVTAGTPLVRMISEGGKKITLGVPARYANVVDLGDEAEIWFDFDDEERYKLPITYIGNSIDPQNRTFRVEIALPGDFRNIKIDMIANVRLRTEFLENVIVVSEEHIFQKSGNYVAYLAAEGGNGQPIAEERVVEMGSSYGNNTVIESGLEIGDELITLGASYLQDGTQIEKVENRSTQYTEN